MPGIKIDNPVVHKMYRNTSTMDQHVMSGCYAGRTVKQIVDEDPGYIARCVQVALIVDGLRPLATSLPTLAPTKPSVPTANLLAMPLPTFHPPPDPPPAANDLASIHFTPTSQSQQAQAHHPPLQTNHYYNQHQPHFNN